MRKSIIVTLSLLILSTASFAGARIGLKAGGNWATLITDYDLGDNVTLSGGFIGGLSFGFGGGDVFEFGPEILFTQKGLRAAVGDSYSKLQLNYIEMPLLFKWSFGAPSNVVRPSIFTGPYGSFLLAMNTKSDIDGVEDSESLEIDSTVNRFDAGMILGAGVGVKVGPGRFILDLRWSVGFIPLTDQSQPLAQIELNRDFSVMGGYVFEF